MSSNSFPSGSDTVAAPMFLVSDESDPAYIAWRSEHPDAFVAGTWTRPASARRPMPPDMNRSRRTDIDPAATVPTRDLVVRSNLSTQEFMQLAAAARAPGPRSPERHQQLTDVESKQRNLDDLATVMYNEAREQEPAEPSRVQ